jgi:hypothetical protein
MLYFLTRSMLAWEQTPPELTTNIYRSRYSTYSIIYTVRLLPRSNLTASIAQATYCPRIKTHKQTNPNTDGDASSSSLPNAVITQENTCLAVQCHEQGTDRVWWDGWAVGGEWWWCLLVARFSRGLEEGVPTFCTQSITYYHQSLPPHDNLQRAPIWPATWHHASQ